MTTQQLTALIAAHTAGAAESLYAAVRAQRRQDRFNRLGLPRALSLVVTR